MGFFLFFVFVLCGKGLLAGVARVDCSLPVGVPLAGLNHGPRRVKSFPVPKPTVFTSFMTPSTGIKADGIWCRALTVQDDAGHLATFVSIDAIGADGTLRRNAVRFARALNFSVPEEAVVLSASHTHSGPGAITSEFLWAAAPATDLEVPALAQMMQQNLALAMAKSQQSMVPAKLDIGTFNLTGVTNNRRCHISKYVNCDTIDPNLGILRIDRLSNNETMALVWNYAMHGTCFGAENLEQTGDIAGWSNKYIESLLPEGAVAMFQNADAGDVDPDYSLCQGDPTSWTGPAIFAKAVMNSAASLSPSSVASIATHTESVDFGPVVLNATLSRFNNCSSGGPIDICTLCRILDCTLDAGFQSAWVENKPDFTGIRVDVNGKQGIFVTAPGEALVEVGWSLRNATQKLGYTNTFFLGYSQNHMGYFCSPNEYDVGGYESQLTLWGINTSNRIVAAMTRVAGFLVPVA